MNKNNQEQEENFMTRQEVLVTFAQGAKKILENNLSKLIVYGSYARGDYKENSDIDVMILTPFSKEENSFVPFPATRYTSRSAVLSSLTSQILIGRGRRVAAFFG